MRCDKRAFLFSNYSKPVLQCQGHYADPRELSKWNWRPLFMSSLVIRSSLTNLKTCSVLQIFIFSTKTQPRPCQRKPSVHRKLSFTGPSSHDIRAPLKRELGPLLVGDHDRRSEDSSSERISTVLSAKTPWARTAHRFDVRHGLKGKHSCHQQINRKVAWRTREKPVLQRSCHWTIHRPAPQNNDIQSAYIIFKIKRL